MRSQREPKQRTPFLINAVDSLGREIDPSVLAVAQEIGAGAVAWAEKLLGDSALVLNLFEGTAAAVSQAIREKALTNEPGVKDLGGYLFIAFARRVHEEEQKQPAFLTLEEWAETDKPFYLDQRDIEWHVLLDELLSDYDRVTQAIVLLRARQYSYKFIEKALGISSAAARKRFSTVIRQLQKVYRDKKRSR